MNTFRFFLLTLVFFSSLSLQAAPQTPVPATEFDTQVYRTLSSQSGNLNFSPLSLKMALQLVYEGTAGKTKNYFEQAFGFKDQNTNAFAKEIALLKDHPEFKLKIANSAWFQNKEEIVPSYFDRLKMQGAEAFPLEVSALNAWVSTATEGKINKLLDRLPPGIKNIFVNAIYFKADWTSPFNKNATRTENFNLTANSKKSVSMMHQSGHFAYGENPSIQTVILRYQGSPFEMMLLLPKKRFDLSKIEKSLSSKELATLEASAQPAKVDLALPKFKFDTKGLLEPLLKQAGYGELFDSGDYGNLYQKNDQAIGSIMQATQIAVDEKGTEAAAATAVMMKSLAMRKEAIEVFHADQPFLFILKNEDSGEIYFMGRVTDPTIAP